MAVIEGVVRWQVRAGLGEFENEIGERIELFSDFARRDIGFAGRDVDLGAFGKFDVGR